MSREKEYPRELQPKSEAFPFDPLELTERTREIVCDGPKRKYTDFYTVGVYGGIVTGYVVGCNLRCYFCWVGPGRDRPENRGKFYSAEQSAEKLLNIASNKEVKKARISGGEPTLCREHLMKLLDHLEEDGNLDTFILETNGILFGKESSYVQELRRFDIPYVRVSLKAGFSNEWEEKTGAKKEYFELLFKAIEHLWQNEIDFHVAAMADPQITSREEMGEIYRRVAQVSRPLAENIEWETVDMYPNTKKRLKHAGIDLE